jgi:hypothetical protein
MTKLCVLNFHYIKCFVMCCVLNLSHMCDAHLTLCFVLVFVMWILTFMFIVYVYYVTCEQN